MTELIGLQLNLVWEDRASNCAKAARLLESAAPAPHAVVALPEMFASGFSMNVDRVAEEEGGVTESFLSEMSKRFEIFLIGGVAIKERPSARATNQAVVYSPDGSLVTRYRKIHPYTPGKEKEHFVGGEQVVTFEPGDAKVAPFVCYDLRFPEIFRAGMRRGANVLVVIANWPTPRAEHWVTLLRARAIENQAYVLGVNRCGNDPYLPYPGRSLIVDYRGNVLADAGEVEGVIRAGMDLESLVKYRAELPFLADARPEFLPPMQSDGRN